MNREILFRGKLNSGEWAYGNLEITKDKIYIITPDDTIIGKYGRVDPETVGQYTTLKDKNGIKIFEGDITEIVSEDGHYEIAWSKDSACFTIENDGYVADFDNYYSTDLEIIGNIHDNPELGGGR